MRIRTIALGAFLGLACLFAPQTTWSQSALQSGHFTTSDDIQLHYLEAGSGPTLVFVPGWTMPAWIWEPQLRHFSANHHVVALDPRGQGRSEKPTAGYHATRRARDICELIEHLDGDPAVVAGWSLAVQEVLVCAQEFGNEAIRAAVLVDHPVAMDPETSRQIAETRLRTLQTDRERWTREFVEAIHARPQADEYFEALTEAALATPTNAAALMIANTYLLGPTDLSSALAALDRPALFVFSSNDWSVNEAESVREEWPGVRVEVIEGTSHAVFVDSPDEFNRVLEEFLAALPQQ